MRRIIALAIIGLTVIGIGLLWLFIPQLTGSDDTVVESTTTTTSQPSAAPETASSTTTVPAPTPVGGSVSVGVV